MTANEYWKCDNTLVIAYRKANYITMERKNHDAWLQGLYIYNAVATVAQNAFAKKGAKKHRYIEKPFDILPKTQEQINREAEKERQKVVDMLTAWSKRWSAEHPQ